MTHVVEATAEELIKHLYKIDGVRSVETSVFRSLLTVVVRMHSGDERSRRAVLETVNQFHRDHVQDLSIDVDVIEVGENEYSQA
jgi:hypothetical protein